MSTENTFASLALADPILRAIAEAGYTSPTPIQAQAIPQVLKGGDLLAAAQTGTGKTAGFTLPILHRLHSHPIDARPGRPRCLILVPTRELAAQVEESVKTYGKHLPMTSLVVFGGVNINPQIAALRKRVDILVATPGRLLDLAGEKNVDLSAVEILVLDEADRMLDMGFIRDIRRVLALLPKKRQNLLFSATFSDEIRELASGLLHEPGYVEVARRNTATELVTQSVHLIGQKQKRYLLAHLIQTGQWQQVLVFTRTKHGANRLADQLSKEGIQSAAIHGNKSQNARTRALADFKSGELRVLVATDIAARGLDIDQLPQVVNFELPNVPEDYVHRIGRTGRAGATGHAVSLVDREELPYLSAIEKLIKRSIDRVEAHGFVPPPLAQQEAAEREDRRPPRPPQGQRGNRNRPAEHTTAGAHATATRATPARNGGGRAPDGNRAQPPGNRPQNAAARPATPAGTHRGNGNATPARPAAQAQHSAPAARPAPTRSGQNRPRAALFAAPKRGNDGNR